MSVPYTRYVRQGRQRQARANRTADVRPASESLTLARALKSRGYRVVVAEPFKWHVARASSCVDASYYLPPPNTNPKLYRDTILALIQHESVDLLVPVSEEAHHVLPLAPQLPENVELIGPAHQLYQELSHKLHFIEKAAALGLRVPATFAIDDPRAATLARDAAHVKKPVRGCSGIEVSLCDKGTTHDSRDSGYVIQEQIIGQPVSTLSLVRQGSVVGTSIYEGRVFAGTVAVGFERCLPGSPGEISVGSGSMRLLTPWTTKVLSPLTLSLIKMVSRGP